MTHCHEFYTSNSHPECTTRDIKTVCPPRLTNWASKLASHSKNLLKPLSPLTEDRRLISDLHASVAVNYSAYVKSSGTTEIIGYFPGGPAHNFAGACLWICRGQLNGVRGGFDIVMGVVIGLIILIGFRFVFMMVGL